MNLLIDTNVVLEILYCREHLEEAQELLDHASAERYLLSDLSLFSLGILTFRHRRPEAFLRFIEEVLLTGRVRVASLPHDRFVRVAEIAGRFGLTFDDAYQYAVAESLDLTIVSFDADFDRTERGCRTPDQVVPA